MVVGCVANAERAHRETATQRAKTSATLLHRAVSIQHLCLQAVNLYPCEICPPEHSKHGWQSREGDKKTQLWKKRNVKSDCGWKESRRFVFVIEAGRRCKRDHTKGGELPAFACKHQRKSFLWFYAINGCTDSGLQPFSTQTLNKVYCGPRWWKGSRGMERKSRMGRIMAALETRSLLVFSSLLHSFSPLTGHQESQLCCHGV